MPVLLPEYGPDKEDLCLLQAQDKPVPQGQEQRICKELVKELRQDLAYVEQTSLALWLAPSFSFVENSSNNQSRSSLAYVGSLLARYVLLCVCLLAQARPFLIEQRDALSQPQDSSPLLFRTGFIILKHNTHSIVKGSFIDQKVLFLSIPFRYNQIIQPIILLTVYLFGILSVPRSSRNYSIESQSGLVTKPHTLLLSLLSRQSSIAV